MTCGFLVVQCSVKKLMNSSSPRMSDISCGGLNCPFLLEQRLGWSLFSRERENVISQDKVQRGIHEWAHKINSDCVLKLVTWFILSFFWQKGKLKFAADSKTQLAK